MKHPTRSDIRQAAIRETRDLLAVFVYLALFFCAFYTYRLLVERELGLHYVHFGFALLKALVLAKVILLGQHSRVAKRLDAYPLLVPTVYKVILFGLLALAFEILEDAVASVFHGQGLIHAFHELLRPGWDELLARTLVMLVAFVPLFAFRELGRVLGEGKLYAWFFQPRPPGV